VTWRKGSNGIGDTWKFYSVRNAFENGASFVETKDGQVTKPNYSPEQNFTFVDAKYVRSLTSSSGACYNAVKLQYAELKSVKKFCFILVILIFERLFFKIFLKKDTIDKPQQSGVWDSMDPPTPPQFIIFM